MASRALVLGGGGTIGIAWEIGVLKGLQAAGLDLSDADLVVGTSAGSVVGALVALGQPVDALVAGQLAPGDPALQQAMVFDPQTLMAISSQWAATPEMTREQRAAIGALALRASTVAEADWVRVFTNQLGGLDWPERGLVITAVDAESGEFIVWDRTAGVPLARAVAASCTVPGLFPPVTINGRRYIDGGVRSGTNADLAREHAIVIIIAPIGTPTQSIGALARRQIEAEVASLRETGSIVDILLPDTAALTAFGPNLMDATRRAIVVEAGIQQGRAEALRLRNVWHDQP